MGRAPRELSGDIQMFYVLIGGVVMWVYTFITILQIVHLRFMHFTVCKFYLLIKSILAVTFHISALSSLYLSFFSVLTNGILGSKLENANKRLRKRSIKYMPLSDRCKKYEYH